MQILSHRGVHQTFHRNNLTNSTCTAKRIDPPTHSFIENTIPSIRAAFEFGADIVEIDVQRTKDFNFALFHDGDLECRTDGVGKVEQYTIDELRALDAGYGYTADKGETYPLRGTGAGLIVSLGEMFRKFPDRTFQINVKSNSARDAEIFHIYLEEQNLILSDATYLWAGPRFAARWRDLNRETPIGTRKDIKVCAKSYFIWGWTGRVPEVCKAYGLIVPQNLRWLAWGWPRKTVSRMPARGSSGVYGGGARGGI